MLEKLTLQNGGADFESEKLKNRIICSNDTISDRKNTYYISENGDDANDGLSPERAIRSFERLAGISLCEGDGILFERGSIFRFPEMLWIKSNNISIGTWRICIIHYN